MSATTAWLDGLDATPDGLLVPVHAQPGARREGLGGLHDGRLRIATTAAPEGGRATARIGALLAAALDVPRSCVRCVRGAAARHKVYAVEGLLPAEVRRRLGRALGAEPPGPGGTAPAPGSRSGARGRTERRT